MAGKHGISRRGFIKKSAGAALGTMVFPYIVPSSVLGQNGNVAPSNRITIGCIGIGWQGTSNMEAFLQEDDCRIIAVCDIDKNHLRDAVNKVNEQYNNTDCAVYSNYRDLLSRDDIDAALICTPDHWHSIIAVEAAKAGKDIYGEKPLAHTLKEGRAICDAVKRYGRIWQTGSWQRSVQSFRFASELVLNGRIGKVHTVEITLPAGHIDFEGTKDQTQFGPAPAELDYDFWLGPALYEPYCPARVHKNWRWHLDYGGGQLMDWIVHHADIAHWSLGLDYTAPVEIEGEGTYPSDGLWNAPTDFELNAKYAGGLKMIITNRRHYTSLGAEWDQSTGIKWFGEDGWICITRTGMDAEPKSLLKEQFGPNDIRLFNSPGHHRNFLDCVKSRRPTITPCEIAQRSATPGYLGLIALNLGRKIRFNPETEEILDDSTASGLLGKAMRSPWHL
jgi:predicted dehydrogenase